MMILLKVEIVISVSRSPERSEGEARNLFMRTTT